MNRTERRQAIRELKKRRAGMKKMTYDITNKLDLGENPKMKIKDIEVEITAAAKTVLVVGDLLNNSTEFASYLQIYEMLFTERDREKIDTLDLNAKDFVRVVTNAVTLAMGNDPDKAGEE